MTTPSPSPTLPAGLARLNSLPSDEAVSAFRKCCGSTRWALAMAANRPYSNASALLSDAESIWTSLYSADWLEAFTHHPRIGERNIAQPRFAATAQRAGREQSGMAAATDDQRRQFADLNAEYERKFGHVFLIYATGKTADFMLTQLQQRLQNDPDTELHNAAREQNMITRLRLERMLTA